MEKNNQHNNHGGGGFLLGVLVGVAITLLFTTKKGREIFKETVDKALEKFSEVKNTLDEEVVYDDEDDGSDYIKQTPIEPVKKEPIKKAPVKEVRYLAAEPQKSEETEKPAKLEELLEELPERDELDEAEEIEESDELEEIEEIEEEKEEEDPSRLIEKVPSPAAKPKPTHAVPTKPDVIPFDESELPAAPEPPKKSSPVRKFFRVKKG